MSQGDEAGEGPTEALSKKPRTVALVAGATVLVLGVPIALLAATGRWKAVAVLVALFVGMILATASWFKQAIAFEEGLRGEDET